MPTASLKIVVVVIIIIIVIIVVVIIVTMKSSFFCWPSYSCPLSPSLSVHNCQQNIASFSLLNAPTRNRTLKCRKFVATRNTIHERAPMLEERGMTLATIQFYFRGQIFFFNFQFLRSVKPSKQLIRGKIRLWCSSVMTGMMAIKTNGFLPKSGFWRWRIVPPKRKHGMISVGTTKRIVGATWRLLKKKKDVPLLRKQKWIFSLCF